MRLRRSSWPILAGALVALVVLALSLYRGQDSPDHRSDSDSAGGASALRAFASALGHPALALDGSFSLPGRPGLLFVLSPDAAYSRDQAEQVRSWVSAGGVLVFASDQPDGELDGVLGLTRIPGPVDGQVAATVPVLSGVHRVIGSPTLGSAFAPGPRQVTLFRNPQAQALGVMEQQGAGKVVALADPLPLSNAYIGLPDDWRLAADLIGLSPPGAPVLFDEYHHGEVQTAYSQFGWLTEPWGAAIAWAVVMLFAGLFIRGRRFGPLIPLEQARDRSSAEYVAAVGDLLRRSGARLPALAILQRATRQQVARRVGLAADSPHLEATLQLRAPDLAARLADAEARLGGGQASDDQLTRVARQLNALAYPTPVEAGAKTVKEDQP